MPISAGAEGVLVGIRSHKYEAVVVEDQCWRNVHLIRLALDKMIELFYATSPNVYKIMLALEEMGLEYKIVPTDISKGEHRDPRTNGGSPAGKLPVILDHAPEDNGKAFTVFESGAILQYLAEKTGRFMPEDLRGRSQVIQWLFWQVGNLGPASGQVRHFKSHAQLLAPDADLSYGRKRYYNMQRELWRVMDNHLADHEYLAHEYSIADMAVFPWVDYLEPVDGRTPYPNVERWIKQVAERSAVKVMYDKIAEVKTGYAWDAANRVAFYPWEGVVKNVF